MDNQISAIVRIIILLIVLRATLSSPVAPRAIAVHQAEATIAEDSQFGYRTWRSPCLSRRTPDSTGSGSSSTRRRRHRRKHAARLAIVTSVIRSGNEQLKLWRDAVTYYRTNVMRLPAFFLQSMSRVDKDDLVNGMPSPPTKHRYPSHTTDDEIAETMMLYLTKALHYFETVKWRQLSAKGSGRSGMNHIGDSSLLELNRGVSDLLCSVHQMRGSGLDEPQLTAIGNTHIRPLDKHFIALRTQRAYFVIHRMQRVMERVIEDAMLLRRRITM